MRISEREAQILEFVEKGLSLKQIGIRLNLSKNTVNSYKRRAIKKLSCVYAI